MPTTNRPAQQPESSVRYIPCKAEPGMLTGELLICIEGFHPEHHEDAVKVQVLVNEREVKGLAREPKGNGPWKGWLKVSLAGVEDGMAEVILPEPAEPVGRTFLVAIEHLGMPDPHHQEGSCGRFSETRPISAHKQAGRLDTFAGIVFAEAHPRGK